MAGSRRLIVAVTAAVLCVLGLLPATGSAAVKRIEAATIQIGNGTQTMDGSYLNAQLLANDLAFTNISVQAVSSIEIVDDIDLSTASFGTPNHTLTLTAPTITIGHGVTMSAFGQLHLNA